MNAKLYVANMLSLLNKGEKLLHANVTSKKANIHTDYIQWLPLRITRLLGQISAVHFPEILATEWRMFVEINTSEFNFRGSIF